MEGYWRKLLRALDAAGQGILAERGGWRWSVGALVVAWLIYALPWILGGQVIPWDAKDFYYPALRALASAFHAGQSGFWDPWMRSGMAAVADPQSWLFTPTFRLLASLVAVPSMHVVDAFQLLHLLAGGLGVLLLARSLGQRPLAAALAAIIFMFGGAAASRLQHTMMTVSYAYLPWALLLLRTGFNGRTVALRVAAGLGFGIIAGLMAVDRDQVAFLNALFLILAAVWWLLRMVRREGAGAAAGQVLELVPGAIAGAIVILIPALVTLDALSDTTRSVLDYQTTGRASLQPAALLTLIAPNIFDGLQSTGYWGPGTEAWLGFSEKGIINDPTTSYLYIGVIPMALAWLVLASGALRYRFLRKGETALLMAGLAFGLFYALGAFTPLFQLMYEYFPGVALYRRPNDAVFLINAMLALLVGGAANAVISAEPEERRVSKTGAWLTGTALASIGLAGIWLSGALGHLTEGAVAMALGVVTMTAAFALLTRYSAKAGAGIWAVLVLVAASADLIAHHSGSVLNARPETSIAAYRPDGADLAAEIKGLLNAPGGPYRAEIFGLDQAPDGGGSWQNAALAYGIEQTLGYDALLAADYSADVGANQNSHTATRRLTKLFTGYDCPLARLLGIRLVVTGHPIETILPAGSASGLQLIERRGGAFIYLNSGALPRVMLVPNAVADTGQSLPTDPAKSVLISGLVADEPNPDSDRPVGHAEIRKYLSDRVEIAADMERPGWLVLNDRFHAGWTATVDGAAVPISRANRLFRGIRLSAGKHLVRFEFHPIDLERLLNAAQPKSGIATPTRTRRT